MLKASRSSGRGGEFAQQQAARARYDRHGLNESGNMVSQLPCFLLATYMSILYLPAAFATDNAVPVTAPPRSVEGATVQPVGGTDFRLDSHWLCRPGRNDICAQPLTVTPALDGSTHTLRSDAAAPIDCFYVYPTISYDASANSDLDAGPEERRAAQHQLVPFGSECRLFAPMYRQATLAALRSRFTGTPMEPNVQMAYGDVRDAWADYLAHDNQGRGVVLIGHSQGARMLANLIAREIEGRPVQGQIVVALLLGSNIAVPKGRDVGGDFKSMPLCSTASQIGCVVAYTAFRADSPPPSDTLFGRVGAGRYGSADPAAFSVACTNPAALDGGSGKLGALIPLRENLLGQPTTGSDWSSGVRASNASFFARLDLQAECIEADGVSYLSVDLPANVPGDVIFNGQLQRNWGLHLVDVNLAQVSLVKLLREKSSAYARSRPVGAKRAN